MNKFHIKGRIRNLILEQLLTESMDVYVEGASYKRLDNLHDLSYYLLDKVLAPLSTKLPDDQLTYFRKNSVPYYDMIVPDGSYDWDKMLPTGIINFYISGFTTQTLQVILKGIFNELRKLGIRWGHLKRERSRMYKSDVIRIPIIKNDHAYSGPPPVNLSNVGAYHIFHNILQYEGTHNFSMEAQELKERIESLSGDKSWITKHVIKPTDTGKKPDVTPGDEWKDDADEVDPDDDPTYNPHQGVIDKIGGDLGARMIGGGMDEVDILARLNAIWNVADWAIKHGYNKISVA